MRDLKLGGNLLHGPLDPCFANLTKLEILDLHGNELTSLPLNFGNLGRLRILNLNENAFEALPFEILSTMPLTELSASKNQLSGTLVQDAVRTIPRLHSLDVSFNRLTHIVSPSAGSTTFSLPALQQLCACMNRLQTLPDLTCWTSLGSLSVGENNIGSVPDGFASLAKLRSADFSCNDIRVIPAEVGLMDTLAILRLSGNPLREKRFSTMDTHELKDILAQRLEPARPVAPTPDVTHAISARPVASSAGKTAGVEADGSDGDDDFATPPTSAPPSPAAPLGGRIRSNPGADWAVKPGGILDRTHTQSSSLHPVICSRVAASHTVREIRLHHNLFPALPESLFFFAETLTSLSLAHNQLVGETYLGPAEAEGLLDFPVLTELKLSNNHMTSLAPLTARLRAPRLQHLDVSVNRLARLPTAPLRDAFPALATLLAAHNQLAELGPAAIGGLRVVDASHNEIAHLDPRIGLLGGGGGLVRLEVGGNRFRVPRWNVLARGTDATLRWLRGRVPVAEMGAWRAENGERGEGEGEGEGVDGE